MNSLRNNNPIMGQSRQTNFNDFMATTSPAAAQAKIQEMLANGQLSQKDFERAKLIAQSLIGK